MTRHHLIYTQLQRLVAQGDWVFALGLRIRFNHPTLLYQTYPEEWVAYYTQNGLMFVDPAVRWGMTNTGICDWRDLAAQDQASVLLQAVDFGLAHGIVVSVGDQTSRSIGFFARSDQPVTPAQRSLAQATMTELHILSDGAADLAPGELAALAALNDTLANRPV